MAPQDKPDHRHQDPRFQPPANSADVVMVLEPSSAWKPLIPLLLFAAFFLYEEWVSLPSCASTGTGTGTTLPPDHHPNNSTVAYEDDEDDLKVMMVANLLLLGSDSGLFNLYFRDYYLSKFFAKSFHVLNPDMLIILGDISARGYGLTRMEWVSVLHQFHRILGPFIELPYHVVLGDRDVGECGGVAAKSVSWLARTFPGLDSAGCGGFEISNVSFVSLNTVPFLCGNQSDDSNKKLRFSVEKAIEAESVELRKRVDGDEVEDGELGRETGSGFGWRENGAVSGSGPVVLLHFPLHRPGNGRCTEGGRIFKDGSNSFLRSRWGEIVDSGPYELSQTVPPNATEYVFQALKPRIIFSAHACEFCDYTHSDGTREVSVPAISWKAGDNPGFVLATFPSGRDVVSVSYCSLARESHVLMVYTLLLVLLLTLWLVANSSWITFLR